VDDDVEEVDAAAEQVPNTHGAEHETRDFNDARCYALQRTVRPKETLNRHCIPCLSRSPTR